MGETCNTTKFLSLMLNILELIRIACSLQVMTTAVNTVVQIEPFKLFRNINEGVTKYNAPPQQMPSGPQLATINSLPGRSNKPAGMAQVSNNKHCLYLRM